MSATSSASSTSSTSRVSISSTSPTSSSFQAARADSLADPAATAGRAPRAENPAPRRGALGAGVSTAREILARARDVLFTGAFFAFGVVLAREAFLFGAAFRLRARGRAARPRFGAALRLDVRLRADPRAPRRALPFRTAVDRELFRPPRRVFPAFLATLNLPVDRNPPGAGSYNSEFVEANERGVSIERVAAGTAVTRETTPRISIEAQPGGLTVEVRPLVRSPAWRRRLIVGALVVGAAALFGAARLVPLWESSLRRGSFSDLPLPLLVFLSLAVGISTPLTLLGLAALAFAEERVEVSPSEVVISTSAFERTRVRRISLDELECWRETWVPLPPWWTWSVKRLAARSGGRLYPLAGGAGPKEKRAIAVALARATGRPLVGDFGRILVPGNS